MPDASIQDGGVDAGTEDAGHLEDAGADAGADDAGVQHQIVTCAGSVYACGDAIDNDGDGRTDSDDPECTGPCDNSEDSLHPMIPGATPAPCSADCFFDQDPGAGNDGCYWSHRCDPLEVAPDYYPNAALGAQCAYNPNATIAGTSQTCSELLSDQGMTCTSLCMPLVPNGCDCFGCCALPASDGGFVYLGSADSSGNGTCSLADVGDPSKCQPCTPVPSCMNECDACELCLGKTSLPPSCTQQTCDNGAAPCGLPGQDACAEGSWCVSGCCRATLQ